MASVHEVKQVQQNQKSRRIATIIIWTFSILYAVACTYLYYMQATHIGGQYFESDLPYHIRMAVEDNWGYSLTAIIYRLCSYLPLMNLWIAIILAVCTSASLILIYYGFFSEKTSPYIACGLTILSGFVMPIFIRAVHYQRYIGYQSPSIWHNSTYIVMKMLAIMTCIFYTKRVRISGEQLNVKNWCVLATLFAITTATKTSFIVVFAPALILMLLFDLWRGVRFRTLFALGATMIPSLVVILIQNAILFGEKNGIVIRFGYTLFMHTGNAPITMILSALFPVLVFLANILPFGRQFLDDCKKIRAYRKLPKEERRGVALPPIRNRLFWGAWLVWFFGALEIMFLCESGSRALDANFAWGYYFALFAVFTVSMYVWVKNMQDKSLSGKWAIAKYAYGATAGAILLWHGYCGFVFFAKLLMGTTYFM